MAYTNHRLCNPKHIKYYLPTTLSRSQAKDQDPLLWLARLLEGRPQSRFILI
jgi:hypothetical protein